MQYVVRVSMSVVVVLVMLVVLLGFVRVQQGQAMQLSLGPVALTPETAVRTMLTSRAGIADFHVIAKQPTDLGMLVVYQYTRQSVDEPPQGEFGYALVTIRLGGWSVTSANLEQAVPDADVSYASARIGPDLLVYGVAKIPAITVVDVTAEGGTSMRQILREPGWSILLRDAQRLQELRTVTQHPEDSAIYRQPAHVRPNDQE